MPKATSQEWLIAEKLARKIAEKPHQSVNLIAEALAKHTAEAKRKLEAAAKWVTL